MKHDYGFCGLLRARVPGGEEIVIQNSGPIVSMEHLTAQYWVF
jgi:hypothetical protein